VKCPYSNLEELIKIGTEDGNEFQTLEKRDRGFFGESQDASIELQPTKFSVDKMGLHHRNRTNEFYKSTIGDRCEGRFLPNLQFRFI
jgi:hypothetical protein